MPRAFSPATAEQVVSAVEAVFLKGTATTAAFVADFCDVPIDRVVAALDLAVDLKLLAKTGNHYRSDNPLCRILSSPKEHQRAAALRIVLDGYEPFLVFRERLSSASVAATAAHQTKVALELSAHRDEIKDTLISLGTYSQALIEQGGGMYRLAEAASENHIEALAEAASDSAAAEWRIREQLGIAATIVSRDEVLVPLAEGLRKAAANDPEGAVQVAGNAVESYLVDLANRKGVSLVGATGLNAKVERLDADGLFPKKLAFFGKYLGHIRNAADHGVDPDIGAAWIISSNTGLEYVFVACSFIVAADMRDRAGPYQL